MLNELIKLSRTCKNPIIVKLSIEDKKALDEEIKGKAVNTEITAKEQQNMIRFEHIEKDELEELSSRSGKYSEGSYLIL